MWHLSKQTPCIDPLLWEKLGQRRRRGTNIDSIIYLDLNDMDLMTWIEPFNRQIIKL